MKRWLSLLLILALLLSCTACGRTEAPGGTQPPAGSTAAAPQAAYPVTITDHAGRTVVIETQPQKLVSGYYICTSMLMALGLTDRLVGIEAKADKRPIYRLAAPQLLTLPNVGTAKEFDLEGCAALEPDLVILPLKLKNAAQSLEALGIDVLLIDPENQQLLTEAIHMVAAATNTQDRAAQLLAFTADQEAFLAQTLAGAETPSVYLAGNSSLLSTAGSAMYQSDLIRLAGGVNAAAEIEEPYWAQISYEQLLAWDPAYILLASDAAYTPEDVLADPNLAGCAAVASGHVYQLPSKAEAWDSPVPSGILGALWLASVLHGELVSQEVCAQRIDAYYETFYGFTYSDQ